MLVTGVQTHPIAPNENLLEIIDQYVPDLPEESVLVVTSKIISICEGRVVPADPEMKSLLVEQEAEYFIPKSQSKYNLYLTVNNGMTVANAGIDESNGNGNYILWPADPFRSAELVWAHLRNSRHLSRVGVLVTDSTIPMLRWGTRGVGMAWCGFLPLRDYIGKEDIFGRPLRMTKMSLLDGLAAAGVTVMGEGNERTPLAVISDVPNLTFTEYPPGETERNALHIELEDDFFAPLLTAIPWKTGGKKRKSQP